MTWQIDGALYPDIPPPDTLGTDAERIDYLHRLCAAWDFGILPDLDAIAEIRRPEWREVIDACDFLTSPTYHLLRKWHGLPEVAFLGTIPAYILADPYLDRV